MNSEEERPMSVGQCWKGAWKDEDKTITCKWITIHYINEEDLDISMYDEESKAGNVENKWMMDDATFFITPSSALNT